jgi:hypothetical protein
MILNEKYKSIIFLILTYCAVSFACQSTGSSGNFIEKNSDASNSVVIESFDDNENKLSNQNQASSISQLMTKEKIKYLGCWSGGDNANTIYYFSDKTIKTSKSKGKVFHYKVVLGNSQLKSYLLELQEKDKNNYLQKYLEINFVADDQIEITLYESFNDFKNKKMIGDIILFKDECKSLLNRL